MRDYYKLMDDRMFDFADFYTWVVSKLESGAQIAEVGLADGTSSVFLAETALNNHLKIQMWAIDSLAYGGAEQLQTILLHYTNAALHSNITLLPMDSLNASCQFPDNFFDFVFIDASHRYEHTKADIRLWYRKVREGGILAGHDYNTGEGTPVKEAVDEVIPPDRLRIEKTSKGLGVWAVVKKGELLP